MSVMREPQIQFQQASYRAFGHALRGLGLPAPFLVFEKLRAETSGSDSGGADSGDNADDGAGGPGTIVVSKPKTRTKTPPLYRVILMNDDYTPMDFVIHVLQKFFNKDITEATQIMLQVHQKGAGVCGVFTFEIAETKVYQVNQYSRQNRHPLKCTMETA
jgi:ATP-dependent Clp protease adaptor protein ClpS